VDVTISPLSDDFAVLVALPVVFAEPEFPDEPDGFWLALPVWDGLLSSDVEEESDESVDFEPDEDCVESLESPELWAPLVGAEFIVDVGAIQ